MFEIVDAARARRWIGGLSGSLQFGDYRRTGRDEPPFIRNVCINLAFTYPGFQALALDPIALRGFSLPFQEGLAEPSRARRLGDDGPSDPSGWAWGRADRPVHGLLAVFGTRCTPEGYAELRSIIDANLQQSSGLRALCVLETTPQDPVLRKEHFGFRDGIANPELASLAKASATDVIADGEMLLGHKNTYGHYPMSPEVPAETDRAGVLGSSDRSPGPERLRTERQLPGVPPARARRARVLALRVRSEGSNSGRGRGARRGGVAGVPARGPMAERDADHALSRSPGSPARRTT